MQSEKKADLRIVAGNKGASSEQLQHRIRGLQSNELVIALSGPVGCGIDTVIEVLKTVLQNSKYTIVHLKLSDLIKKSFKQISVEQPELIPAGLKAIDLEKLEGYERIDKLRRKIVFVAGLL